MEEGPPGSGPSPIPVVPPTAWQADGALVKEKDHPQVYVMAGGAKFWISTPQEFTAGGYSWSKVIVLPDGTLDPVPTTPAQFTVLRARDLPDVWFMDRGRKVWVPTPDALFALGLDWSKVLVVPSGSLDAFPALRLLSSSATPGSMVFPPQLASGWSPPKGKWFPRAEVPGTPLPSGAQVVSLRGWIRSIGGKDAGDPDWHLQFEPDPASLDELGVDWSTFFKVGDILSNGIRPLTSDYKAYVACPAIHVEVNGFPMDPGPQTFDWTGARLCPSDWQLIVADPTMSAPDQAKLAKVRWPFDPSKLVTVGQYVTMSGSLVTDIPHGVGPGIQAYQDAANDWDSGHNEYDEDCPARWTEMHPPDGFAAATAGTPSECVYGVAVVAHTGPLDFSSLDREVSIDLTPPGNRPAHCMAGAREYVGGETNFRTITAGNPTLTGAQLTSLPDRVSVYVKVTGAANSGVPGKFKAIYRVSWVPDPNSYSPVVQMTPDPATIPYGTAVSCVVTARDNETGQEVDGAVAVNGQAVGRTGTAFTTTFSVTQERVWIPPITTVHPPVVGHWGNVPAKPALTVHVTTGQPYRDGEVLIGTLGALDLYAQDVITQQKEREIESYFT